MSYDLNIFEWPKGLYQPENLERIHWAIEGIRTDELGGNPKFVALAQALLNRYPMAPGAGELEGDNPDVDEAVDDDAIDWPYDPVQEARGIETAVWRMSVPNEQRLGVLRLLVDTAKTLGLVVHDEQLSMAWMPSGQVFPAGANELWGGFKEHQDSAPPLKTKAQIRKAFIPALKALLAKNGFEFVKPGWGSDIEAIRKIDGGQQSVGGGK
jgi:hypothetical protein